jgi:hypothetical protein
LLSASEWRPTDDHHPFCDAPLTEYSAVIFANSDQITPWIRILQHFDYFTCSVTLVECSTVPLVAVMVIV